MFVMVDYVRKMTVKKSCKYGDYGSFEYLLLLFVQVVSDISCFVEMGVLSICSCCLSRL